LDLFRIEHAFVLDSNTANLDLEVRSPASESSLVLHPYGGGKEPPWTSTSQHYLNLDLSQPSLDFSGLSG